MSYPYEVVIPRRDSKHHDVEIHWCFKNVGEDGWAVGVPRHRDPRADVPRIAQFAYEFANEQDAILFSLKFS